MSEQEWLTLTDPEPLMDYLCVDVTVNNPDRVSERKFRLFACACCRRIWEYSTEEKSRIAVSVAERYADGMATKVELENANQTMEWLPSVDSQLYRDFGDPPPTVAQLAALIAWRTCTEDAHFIELANVGPECAVLVSAAANYGAFVAAFAEPECLDKERGILLRDTQEQAAQCQIVRDIFGNPFRPVTIDPTWRTPAVTTLAQSNYDHRRFEDMPLLADVLAEAGCTNDEILDHCRGPGEHVRGCWVVDLMLGKE